MLFRSAAVILALEAGICFASRDHDHHDKGIIGATTVGLGPPRDGAPDEGVKTLSSSNYYYHHGDGVILRRKEEGDTVEADVGILSLEANAVLANQKHGAGDRVLNPVTSCQTGVDVCKLTGTNGGTFIVGSNSCDGERACYSAGRYGGVATIGDNSCLGERACDTIGYFDTATIGSESCAGYVACGGVGLGSPGSVGDRSCNGEKACQSGGGATVSIGSDSCNCDGCCEFLPTLSEIGDCQCNSRDDECFGDPSPNGFDPIIKRGSCETPAPSSTPSMSLEPTLVPSAMPSSCAGGCATSLQEVLSAGGEKDDIKSFCEDACELNPSLGCKGKKCDDDDGKKAGKGCKKKCEKEIKKAIKKGETAVDICSDLLDCGDGGGRRSLLRGVQQQPEGGAGLLVDVVEW
eukprot:CAMPEP_0117012822 /NCGR_PEP_ID=MMETSP0472-20121206/10703_1 /TAXON_ID=693140 ORGANISM="Tiarina fusus, Strain LIS" /NCGR_SAMPLE_ID=MMETSP0472 /ASSEMBLY_ACC=CAM_ASM_000603 /LENGTH=405 /DNA_ID=CAMNT_0004715977 /DNA_START=56 /DNA_END=1270 /DNA_ORIENTATION=-